MNKDLFFYVSWIYIFQSSGTVFDVFVIREICKYFRVISQPTTFARIVVFTFVEILASLKLVDYTKLEIELAHLKHLQVKDW